jgi:hypothetical protein
MLTTQLVAELPPLANVFEIYNQGWVLFSQANTSSAHSELH